MGYDKYKELGAYHWGSYFGVDDVWHQNWYKRFVNKVLKEMPKKGTVLDIGCGDGLISGLLAKQGMKVRGFDKDEYAIHYANEKCVGEYQCDGFIVAGIENIKVIEETDYMIAINFIEHIGKPELLVDLFKDFCKKYMLLSTDQPYMWLRRYDVSRYSMEDLEKLFEGYEVKKLMDIKNEVYLVKISK